MRTLLTILVLLAAMLAGCGNEKDEDGGGGSPYLAPLTADDVFVPEGAALEANPGGFPAPGLQAA